jgi:hypothetical protein
MKSDFIELSIPTGAGRFVARYSEKGLAELDFPSHGCRGRGNESQISPGAGVSVRDSSRRLLPISAKISRWHRSAP